MNKISKLIVETFEKERPDLCKAIKHAVDLGETRPNFDRFLRIVLANDHDKTVTYPLCLTVFDYYRDNSSKPTLIEKP